MKENGEQFVTENSINLKVYLPAKCCWQEITRVSEGQNQLVFDLIASNNLGYEILNNVKPGTGKIWMSDLGCVRGQKNLFDCNQRKPLGVNNCKHDQDVGLRCIKKR